MCGNAWLLKRSGKGVEHYGAGFDGALIWRLRARQPLVVHLMPDGLHAERWQQGQWTAIGQADDGRAAIERFVSVRDIAYDVFGSNCEHFARFIVLGRKESRQLQALAACLAVGLIYWSSS